MLLSWARTTRLLRGRRRYNISWRTLSSVNNSKKERHAIKFDISQDIGHLARGSVFCSHGGSVVHSTICSKSSTEEGQGFLPLTVDYKSKYSAFGRIPKNSNRRERHGTDDEILASRVIDRSIRPLFDSNFRDETQIITTAHAVDSVHDPIVLGINATSCALLQAGLPWTGPVGCVRVGLVDDELIANPTIEELDRSTLDLLYTGTTYRTIMVEATGNEITEPKMVAALRFAHAQIQSSIEEQWKQYAASFGQEEASHRQRAQFSVDSSLEREKIDGLSYSMSELHDFALECGLTVAKDAFSSAIPDKAARGVVEDTSRQDIVTKLLSRFPDASKGACDSAVSAVMSQAFRENILRNNYENSTSELILRPDGRKLDDVRQIDSKHDVFPSVHGSSFFQRGDTRVLASVTLGPRDDARTVECLQGRGEVNHYFYLHYDFPPYCTGEIGNATSFNRRMIGHGNLAEKAVRRVMPGVSEFPYTVRVNTECTSSSGSSSMASACAASLALMDAGVPIKSPVAGVSIGLVIKSELNQINTADEDSAASISSNWVLLTDILGTEDYYGDMDCKVAGTSAGITAIQLDIKPQHGIPLLALEQALYKAKSGRENILQTMNEDIGVPRRNVKPVAPLAAEIKFDPERKRHLIGPGGEMVRYIESTYDVQIDTSEEGYAFIYGKSHRGVSEAELLVQDLVLDPQEGDNYLAEVCEIKDFGCVVRLTRAQNALLHISEMTHSEKLRRKGPAELVALGQRLRVQVIGVDREHGAIKVSRKVLLHNNGSKTDDDLRPQPPSEEDRQLAIGALPNFPLSPPRKWSPDFFTHSVASQEDISRAVEEQSAAVLLTNLQNTADDNNGSSGSIPTKIKLEKIDLTKEDLVEFGEQRLKEELRARGKDFRGNTEELAVRLHKVLSNKKKFHRRSSSTAKTTTKENHTNKN